VLALDRRVFEQRGRTKKPLHSLSYFLVQAYQLFSLVKGHDPCANLDIFTIPTF